MSVSKDTAEAKSTKGHSESDCSGFNVPSRHRTESLGIIAGEIISSIEYQNNVMFSMGYMTNASFFDSFRTTSLLMTTPPTVPPFTDWERKSVADKIALLNITHPEAPLRPFSPVVDLNKSIQAKSGAYHPLPDGGAFRLLEILPGEGDMLECKLHVCTLKENATAYEALSYTWGVPDASNDQKITIISKGINHSMLITGSLYVALRELRRINASRVVWADAICINQEDVKERGQQVALMGRIFSGAWQVVVWLGGRSDRCMCGKTVLEESLSSTSKAFSGVCSVVNNWLAQAGQKSLEATYSNEPKDGQSTVHHGNIDDTAICQSAMMQLFHRRWFSRIWVLQEAVLASHAIVQLGSYRIAWEWVGLAAAIVVHEPELTLGRPKVPAGAMNCYLMYRLSISQKCFPGLEFSFAQLLQVTRQFESKEPKDKIYGLLGIQTTDSVGKQIVPDYRETTTAENVFEDIARLVLKTASPLTFLSGAGTLGDFDHSGPSWVPSWHKRRAWTILPTKQNPGFQCASGAPMDLNPDMKAGELVLKGVIIDQITSIYHDYGGIFDKLLDKMCDNLLYQPRWSKEAWKKCAMTLTCGGDGRAYPIDDEAAHLADLAALVLSRSAYWIIRNLVDLRDIIEPEGDDVTQVEFLNGTVEGGNAHRYVSAVEPVRGPYRLFETASKDFGVGPFDMKIGDKLCALFGAEVPFLLRPKGDGYLVVGECYVYDLMHGEVLEKLAADSDGQLKAEWIKLI